MSDVVQISGCGMLSWAVAGIVPSSSVDNIVPSSCYSREHDRTVNFD